MTERISAALACAALDVQLSGTILLDLDPALVFPLARWLAELIGGEPPIIPLGPGLAEESLWERIVRDPVEGSEFAGLKPGPGPLAGYGRRPGIVVVPDLALLTLPATRAAVALVGADVAHLERSGVSQRWPPRDRWLAVLRRQDAGAVSPHLLDRFAVRLDAASLTLPRNGQPVLPAPLPEWRRAVSSARLPRVSAGAADRVVALIPEAAPGRRRDLALGRMARALAGLAGAAVAEAVHVDEAAEITGVRVVPAPAAAPRVAEERSDHSLPPQAAGRPGGAVVVGIHREPLPPEQVSDYVARDMGPGPGITAPYPEDEAEPRREADSLRIGWQRTVSGPPRGLPIGTQQARDERDIAVAATLLHAARYQAVRCAEHYQQSHPLHVQAADLRSYSRLPGPAHLLVLVLDHSCRAQDWDWYEPLAPYLSWAYSLRAGVGVVELGGAVDGDPAADRASEFRATQLRARNMLDPQVAAALERAPGRATPLAHGLTLAAAMLRHDTQQGNVPASEALLVVVTDGRANVPLTVSQTGRPSVRVGQSGIRDALDAARAIRSLHRVRSVVIDPGLRPDGHLTTALAEALAAQLEHGSPLPAEAV